jgi:dihydropteroate synthase
MPKVMGILNVTPDSFSDGGQHNDLDGALQRALVMIEEGADLIDVGGESTRPGAAEVSEQEELDRVIPVIERLRSNSDVTISVDTSNPVVMQAAVAAGARLINDVRALQRPGALEMAARLDVMVCLMHMQGEPGTMQDNPSYQDVTMDVHAFLAHRIMEAEAAGLRRKRLLIDPGFGFGKTAEHNLQLLNRLHELETLKVPVLVGLSRKRLIHDVLARPVHERLWGSLSLAVIAAMKGARVIRTHDVAATSDVVRMAWAVCTERP